MRTLLLLLLTLLALPLPAAAQLKLTVVDRQGSKSFTIAQLLSDPAARTISIDKDVSYKRAMTYRAIPVQVLLRDLKIAPDDYIQARASDGFSVGIPARLLAADPASGVEAFVAIEKPGEKWPNLPGKKESAGPFFLVWQAKTPGLVSSEYWPYKLAELSVADSPFKRWPGLAVDASVPATDPIRRGLDRFVAVCIACHRFKGEGEGEQGPDLGQPMNPVEYFQLPALKKLLRDPTSVRTWPDRKMPTFDPEMLSDDDIDGVIAWLGYKAGRK
jgi:mono/diheme cytochrome c family protein